MKMKRNILLSISLFAFAVAMAQAPIKLTGVKNKQDTQVAVENDVLTGHFLTKNCHGTEKVRRLQALFPDREHYHLTAFGDSGGDRALLAFADEAHFKPFRTE